jgi:hypothetical protein
VRALKTLLIIVAVVVVATVAVRLLTPSDQKRIAKTINKACGAMESESIDDFMSAFSLAYRDEYGLAYLPLKRVVSDMFSELDHIKVGRSLGKVTVNGDTADVALDVWATGTLEGQRCRIVGTPGNPERLTVKLVKGEFKWAIISSHWETFPSVEALAGWRSLGAGVP